MRNLLNYNIHKDHCHAKNISFTPDETLLASKYVMKPRFRMSFAFEFSYVTFRDISLPFFLVNSHKV